MENERRQESANGEEVSQSAEDRLDRKSRFFGRKDNSQANPEKRKRSLSGRLELPSGAVMTLDTSDEEIKRLGRHFEQMLKLDEEFNTPRSATWIASKVVGETLKIKKGLKDHFPDSNINLSDSIKNHSGSRLEHALLTAYLLETAKSKGYLSKNIPVVVKSYHDNESGKDYAWTVLQGSKPRSDRVVSSRYTVEIEDIPLHIYNEKDSEVIYKGKAKGHVEVGPDLSDIDLTDLQRRIAILENGSNDELLERYKKAYEVADELKEDKLTNAVDLLRSISKTESTSVGIILSDTLNELVEQYARRQDPNYDDLPSEARREELRRARESYYKHHPEVKVFAKYSNSLVTPSSDDSYSVEDLAKSIKKYEQSKQGGDEPRLRQIGRSAIRRLFLNGGEESNEAQWRPDYQMNPEPQPAQPQPAPERPDPQPNSSESSEESSQLEEIFRSQNGGGHERQGETPPPPPSRPETTPSPNEFHHARLPWGAAVAVPTPARPEGVAPHEVRPTARVDINTQEAIGRNYEALVARENNGIIAVVERENQSFSYRSLAIYDRESLYGALRERLPEGTTLEDMQAAAGLVCLRGETEADNRYYLVAHNGGLMAMDDDHASAFEGVGIHQASATNSAYRTETGTVSFSFYPEEEAAMSMVSTGNANTNVEGAPTIEEYLAAWYREQGEGERTPQDERQAEDPESESGSFRHRLGRLASRFARDAEETPPPPPQPEQRHPEPEQPERPTPQPETREPEPQPERKIRYAENVRQVYNPEVPSGETLTSEEIEKIVENIVTYHIGFFQEQGIIFENGHARQKREGSYLGDNYGPDLANTLREMFKIEHRGNNSGQDYDLLLYVDGKRVFFGGDCSIDFARRPGNTVVGFIDFEQTEAVDDLIEALTKEGAIALQKILTERIPEGDLSARQRELLGNNNDYGGVNYSLPGQRSGIFQDVSVFIGYKRREEEGQQQEQENAPANA